MPLLSVLCSSHQDNHCVRHHETVMCYPPTGDSTLSLIFILLVIEINEPKLFSLSISRCFLALLSELPKGLCYKFQLRNGILWKKWIIAAANLYTVLGIFVTDPRVYGMRLTLQDTDPLVQSPRVAMVTTIFPCVQCLLRHPAFNSQVQVTKDARLL